MAMAMKAGMTHRCEGGEGQILYCALLPLFLATEGAHRILARRKSDEEGQDSTERSWIDEARSQSSVATSYALMAMSMLQSSERRHRPERLS